MSISVVIGAFAVSAIAVILVGLTIAALVPRIRCHMAASRMWEARRNGTYTDWSPRRELNHGHGYGIGVITFDRGSVQAHLREDGYFVQWFGRQRHPVGYEDFIAKNLDEFDEKVRCWTLPSYVDRIPVEAGPHWMMI